MLGSLGVIGAAIMIGFTGWTLVDPLVAAAIGLFVLPRIARLGRAALRILMQDAPVDVDVAALGARLRALPGVQAVHDLHVWTLTSGMNSVSAHLRIRENRSERDVLAEAQRVLRDDFRVDHSTLQIETAAPSATEPGW
jgi:cobalt-zinc-cadmium efflux system protein